MAEEFYTQSRHGVLWGLHFQLPPNEVAKLVQCVSGVVMDAVVDLRRGSPTYCRYETFELRGENGDMVLILPRLKKIFVGWNQWKVDC